MKLISKGAHSTTGVLFIHGYMGNAIDWDFLIPYLSKKHFCIILDLNNTNELPIDWPSNLTSGIALTEANLKKLLEKIKLFEKKEGINQWKILGYSMGGRLAAFLALSLRVKTLIMESSSFGFRTKREREERFVRDKLWYEAIENDWSETLIRKWYYQDIFIGIDQNKEQFAALIKNRLLISKSQALTQLVLYGQAFMPQVKIDELNRTKICLLAGELDIKYSNLAKEWKNRYSQITVKIRNGAGHNVHFYNSNWYAKIVEDML